MDNMSNKFGLPQSLLDAVRNIQKEETEYQAKVKALMKKKGITSMSQLSPDEKKAFFNQLDAMHKAKHEEVKPDVAKSFPASGVKKHIAPKGVSTMPKDKEKAKGQPAGSLKKEEIELDEGKVKELMMDINVVASKMEKNKMLKPFAGKFVTAAKKSLNIKKSLEDVLPDYISGAEIAKLYKEEIELEEGKSGTGYELYHKDFSSAMSHAYDFAKKKYGIEVDPQEIDRNVAMGPKKPSSGKANAYRLLDKTGKKAIQVQVTNLDNKRYELNMYKEEIELEESGGPVVYKKGDDHIEKYGDEKFAVYKNGKKTKYYKSMDDAKAALEEAKDEGASKKKETEFHTKLDKLVHKTFGSSPSEKKEKMKKEERDPPFTPDKPKKNPGVVPGKHGAGPSIAKHLAKMAMKKQQEKKPVKEASSPAQQAAIAISMKKAGKTPKEEGVMIPGKMKSQARKVVGSIMSEEEIAEAFSSAQIDKLRQEYSKINKVDPSSDTYKKLIAMLDKLDLKTLQSLAGAKIKFVSPLAQNRVVRKMNEEKTVGAKKEATGNEKPVKKGEKVSGKQEPITIDPEVDEKK